MEVEASIITPLTSTVALTSIYHEFWGSKYFRDSVDRVGLPLHNCWKGEDFTGNGNVIRAIYERLVELKDKYKYAIYADGADSLFLKPFQPPDYILYSTEKAIWESPLPELDKAWTDYYNTVKLKDDTKWIYLNGGGYCGPIKLLIEYFEKYELSKLEGNVLAQSTQSFAFMKAHKEGFPIELDTKCEYFQTGAFEDPGDFTILSDKTVKNNITQTVPCLWHFNGRTNGDWLYNLYK